MISQQQHNFWGIIETLLYGRATDVFVSVVINKLNRQIIIIVIFLLRQCEVTLLFKEQLPVKNIWQRTIRDVIQNQLC